MIYFTADYHLYHYNIIKYCNRPFSSPHQMHQSIIDKHNRVVSPEDTVYFLGDLTMEGPEHFRKIKKIIDKLNGNFIMILGNHDEMKPTLYLNMGFSSVHTSLVIYPYDEPIFLCHDPCFVQPGLLDTYPGSLIALCGHIHDLFKISNVNSYCPVVNVGVDVWDFYPVALNTVYNELTEFEDQSHIVSI